MKTGTGNDSVAESSLAECTLFNRSSSEYVSGRSFGILTALTAAVFVSYSLIRFPVPGVNEPHYLCKARAFADANWCRGDFFLQSSNAHAVFFALTGPVTRWLSFESTAVVGRIFSLSLLAVGWSMLNGRLKLNTAGGVFAAAAFCGIAITGNFSGEWVVGGFESKVPAYGCALISVAFWLDACGSPAKRLYLVAGIFAGLSVALHPVVGAWFCIGIALSEWCVWCASLLLRKTDGLRSLQTLMGHGLVFSCTAIAVSLPGLIPAVRMILSSESTRAESDQANLIQIFWRLAHHLDPSTFPKSSWIHTAVLLCVTSVGLLVVSLLSRKSAQDDVAPEDDCVKARPGYSSWRMVCVLLLMSLVIAATGTAIGWHEGPASAMNNWQLRASLLKFYPFRFFDAFLPMITSFVLASVCGVVLRRFGKCRWLLTGAVVVAVLVAAERNKSTAPSGYSPVSFAAWKQACQWLRGNVAADSLIYGPREGFGLKWYSERAEYVCFKDCPQDAAGILEWNRRLWVIHDWARTGYSDGRFDDTDLRKLHQLTKVTHILTKRLGPFESPPIYENRVWRIYAVPLPVQTNDRSR